MLFQHFVLLFHAFTYSIANGIALGLITYCIIKLLTAQFKEIETFNCNFSNNFYGKICLYDFGIKYIKKLNFYFL